MSRFREDRWIGKSGFPIHQVVLQKVDRKLSFTSSYHLATKRVTHLFRWKTYNIITSPATISRMATGRAITRCVKFS